MNKNLKYGLAGLSGSTAAIVGISLVTGNPIDPAEAIAQVTLVTGAVILKQNI